MSEPTMPDHLFHRIRKARDGREREFKRVQRALRRLDRANVEYNAAQRAISRWRKSKEAKR